MALQDAKAPNGVVLTESDRQRFAAKVQAGAPQACWPWQGSCGNRFGHGQFTIQAAPGEQKHLYAHRVAWILTHGSIPDGQWVLHHCDNPACVNPAHLFLGTHTDNMRDASAKWRLSVPRRRTRAFKQVVIDRYLAGGISAEALGAEYGVHQLTVLRWAHEAGAADLRAGRSGNYRQKGAA